MKDEKAFRRAQWRFIVCSMVAYAFFYLTRKNLSMAQPGMLEEGVISTYALGTIMTVHGVVYGCSRFVNGFWADRLNGRIFMTVGLALSAAMNILFGCTSLSLLFAAFWIVNGFTQGMGFPPCAKMLTHWIHPSELATKQSLWNTSHSFGAVMALGLCSLLLGLGFNWRWCFWVPGVLAALAAVFCFFFVHDSPTEAGVEELEIEGSVPTQSNNQTIKHSTNPENSSQSNNQTIKHSTNPETSSQSNNQTIKHSTNPENSSQSNNQTIKQSNNPTITLADRRRLVFGNKVIWLVAIANFFVYVVRFGFLDWGPTFLKQFKGIPVAKGGLMIIAFELAAVVGTIFAGWVTDRFFAGRGQRTCVFCMLFTAFFSFGFWYLPDGAPIWAATLLLMGAGFCIYGPQALIGIVASNQATKEAAAMANGFTGIMGYASTTVSGIGIAFIKEHFGWGVTLGSIAGFALVGMVLFLFAWNTSANGYGRVDNG